MRNLKFLILAPAVSVVTSGVRAALFASADQPEIVAK